MLLSPIHGCQSRWKRPDTADYDSERDERKSRRRANSISVRPACPAAAEFVKRTAVLQLELTLLHKVNDGGGGGKQQRRVTQQRKHHVNYEPGAPDRRVRPCGDRAAQRAHQRHQKHQRKNKDAEAGRLVARIDRQKRDRNENAQNDIVSKMSLTGNCPCSSPARRSTPAGTARHGRTPEGEREEACRGGER